MSLSGILSSCLLCDDSGAEIGWTDCVLALMSPVLLIFLPSYTNSSTSSNVAASTVTGPIAGCWYVGALFCLR